MLKIEIQNVERITIIHITGDLVSTIIEKFESTSTQALKNNPEILAINMKFVTHIDSIAINHLFRLTKKANEENIKLIIYDVSQKIKEILEVIKFDRIVKITSKEQFEKDYLNAI